PVKVCPRGQPLETLFGFIKHTGSTSRSTLSRHHARKYREVSVNHFRVCPGIRHAYFVGFDFSAAVGSSAGGVNTSLARRGNTDTTHLTGRLCDMTSITSAVAGPGLHVPGS